MMRGVMTLACLLLAACGPSAEEEAQKDAMIIDMMNEVKGKLPPPRTMAPEQFTADDFTRMDDDGGSCAFYLGSAPEARAVMVGRPRFGWIKVSGEVVRLDSDNRSAAGPIGTRSRYTGREYTVWIAPQNPDRVGSTAPRQIIPGQLMVRDRWDQVVFASAGELRCAAQ